MTFAEIEAAIGRTSKEIGVFVSGLPTAIARIVYFHPTSGLFVTQEVRDSVPVLFLSESSDNVFLSRAQFDEAVRTTIDNSGGNTDWTNTTVSIPPEGLNMVRVRLEDEPETPRYIPTVEHMSARIAANRPSRERASSQSTYIDSEGLLRRHIDHQLVDFSNEVISHRDAIIQAWGSRSSRVADYDRLQASLQQPLVEGQPVLPLEVTETPAPESESESIDEEGSFEAPIDFQSMYTSEERQRLTSLARGISESQSRDYQRSFGPREVPLESVPEPIQEPNLDRLGEWVQAAQLGLAASMLNEDATPAVETVAVPTIDLVVPTPNRATRRGHAQRDTRGRFSPRSR